MEDSALALARTGVLAAVLLAGLARADFGHDDPRPHALASDLEKLRADVSRLNADVVALRTEPGDHPRPDDGLAGRVGDVEIKVEVAAGRVKAVERRVSRVERCCADHDPAWWWIALAAGVGAAVAWLLGTAGRIASALSALEWLVRMAGAPYRLVRRFRTRARHATNEEKPDMAEEQEVNRSNLRFEIRLAENREPYFAVVFTSNGNDVVASQPYGGSTSTAMNSLTNAMDRLRGEAYSATLLDRREEGPIPGAAPKD